MRPLPKVKPIKLVEGQLASLSKRLNLKAQLRRAKRIDRRVEARGGYENKD